jgi:hypothetical protein
MRKKERQPKLSDSAWWQANDRCPLEFPEIEHLHVEVIKLASFVWGKRVEAPSLPYTDRFPICLDCDAPDCYRGGFQLDEIVRSVVKAREQNHRKSAKCQGQRSRGP